VAKNYLVNELRKILYKSIPYTTAVIALYQVFSLCALHCVNLSMFRIKHPMNPICLNSLRIKSVRNAPHFRVKFRSAQNQMHLRKIRLQK